MSHPILVIIILAAALYTVYRFKRWKAGKTPEQIRKATTLWTLYFIIGVLVLLVVTGRAHWLFAVLASIAGALIPVLKRGLPFFIRYLPFLARMYQQAKATRTAQGSTQGQQSKVETEYLRMTLDHDSGEINGEVLQGALRGRYLSELPLAQIFDLIQECQLHDTEAIPLLEAYLDRMHGSEWRNQTDEGYASAGNQASSGQMTIQEAYEILGLEANASAQDILDAHRRLMQKLHPDRGGSTYLASKINQAKGVLLK